MRVCKVYPPDWVCRMCVDTWESMSGNVEDMQDCSECKYNIEEYEVIQISVGIFGAYAILQKGGKLTKVGISSIHDLREV